ncbi:MAG: DNA repair protein RecO [Chroococcidiopsidaceae cyanobacterium CP_BM_ER_R8_30]|nr:DNA repair protein RecO [Chroococcidiopsidaceae cyanobacterium CP_BM_ER_R8_30]
MGRTYKATGINLKGMPLGESDRLLVILTREYGLLRAVAPGARKHHSGLSGRSGLFVVNELLIASGRSLDKIIQAQTIESYPGLSQDLGKLAASQYLAEMVLAQALSDQPQEELFCLLNEHLSRLGRLPDRPASLVLAHLTHAVFHLLALAGVTPQVQVCCLTQLPLIPDFTDPDWRVGFSVAAGGTVSLSALGRLETKGSLPGGQQQPSLPQHPTTCTIDATISPTPSNSVAEAGASYQTINHRQEKPVLNTRLNATELSLLQQLAEASLPQQVTAIPNQQASLAPSWRFVEQILRQYVQYYFGRPIRSATLIDSYFASLPTYSTNHDATV